MITMLTSYDFTDKCKKLNTRSYLNHHESNSPWRIYWIMLVSCKNPQENIVCSAQTWNHKVDYNDKHCVKIRSTFGPALVSMTPWYKNHNGNKDRAKWCWACHEVQLNHEIFFVIIIRIIRCQNNHDGHPTWTKSVQKSKFQFLKSLDCLSISCGTFQFLKVIWVNFVLCKRPKNEEKCIAHHYS